MRFLLRPKDAAGRNIFPIGVGFVDLFSTLLGLVLASGDPGLGGLVHHARAIDLPADGHEAPPVTEARLQRDAQAIVAAIKTPTWVVGHSMAGYPITAAAERDPSLMAGLISLRAYAPRSDQRVAQMHRAGPRQPLAPA